MVFVSFAIPNKKANAIARLAFSGFGWLILVG
jgi:hypothetical protein